LATRRWRRFLAGEPQFVGGWMELTWCLNMLGEHEDALTAAHKAVELDPEQPGALANLGGTLLEMGRKDEALAWIDKALALDPEDAITQSLREQADGKLA
jgi:Flp pilus assembly protein TadD